MTAGLLAGIAGLALLDSFNPATIGLVTLILLLPGGRSHAGRGRRGTGQVVLALGIVAGAALTVFALGAAIYAAAQGAAVAGGLLWVRRAAFGLAALALLAVGLRRLRPRHRAAVALPSWFSPWTAVPVGAVITAVDLPNAFPYFVAIERLVAAGTGWPVALLVLAGYAVVYCLPCLVLLVVGLLRGDRVRQRLDRLYQRFGAARDLPASRTTATVYTLGALAVAGIAVSV
ncbi:GAP family protein [Actinomycetospora atypica]|uniref:GAP family protein n=1 Tax=Actinomycetospora atypica TaxID=1290095 RepID=A0ABV9YGJ2_9PSEU